MKLKPTPTSPKARITTPANELAQLYHDEGYHTLDRPAARQHVPYGTLLLAILFGFLAGIIGELVFNVYLVGEGGLFTTSVTEIAGQPSPKVSGAQKQDASTLARNIEAVNTSMLALFALRPTTTLPDGVYDSSQQIGSALLLTDDGWAVTTDGLFEKGKSYAAVTSDRKVLAVSTPLVDPATGITFFRIDGSRYPVVTLGDGSDAVEGETYYALAGSGQQQLSSVHAVTLERSRARRGSVIESSDAFSSLFVVDEPLRISYFGGALMNKKGVIVGIVHATAGDVTMVWPVTYVREALNGVLKDQKIVRTRFGISYLDLARAPGIPETARFRRNEGALVQGTADTPAVASGSPASAAGIKEGDVITKVGAEPLTELFGLSEAIQRVKPGQSVELTLIRKNTELTVKAVLDERSS